LDEPEAQIILDALMGKDSAEKVLYIAEQHNSSIFAKCILTRTKKSLEHLKTSIKSYRVVFEALYSGANQSILLDQVLHVFELEPNRCLKVVQKLA
jgi:hypothetical protein